MKKKYCKIGLIAGVLVLGVMIFGGFGNTSKGNNSTQFYTCAFLLGKFA